MWSLKTYISPQKAHGKFNPKWVSNQIPLAWTLVCIFLHVYLKLWPIKSGHVFCSFEKCLGCSDSVSWVCVWVKAILWASCNKSAPSVFMSSVKHSPLPLCAVRGLLFSLLVTENMFPFTNFTNPRTTIPAAIPSVPGGLTVHSVLLNERLQSGSVSCWQEHCVLPSDRWQTEGTHGGTAHWCLITLLFHGSNMW